MGYHFNIEAEVSQTPDARYVQVALPLPLRQTFTYRLPEGLREAAAQGSRLLVPFGKRSLTGYIVDLTAELEPELGLSDHDLKDAVELLDDHPLITPEILKLTRWMADYYAASWGEMLKAALPAGINSGSERVIAISELGKETLNSDAKLSETSRSILEFLDSNGDAKQSTLEAKFGETAAKKAVRSLSSNGLIDAYFRSSGARVKPKLRKMVRLLEPAQDAPERETAQQKKVLQTLAENGGEMPFVELTTAAGTSASAVNTLAKNGRVEVFIAEVMRDPLSDVDLPELEKIELNPEQKAALAQIDDAIKNSGYQPFLLHGITGSGKTEVYIRAMHQCLKLGRSALMLVPEISLTPMFSTRLRSVFGSEVAILHSNLSPGERFDEWRRIYRGAAKVAIGTRSAIFAPLQSLGLVIVDEEHDASYRQHEAPFYNARDAAVVRANFASAAVVLGSATPSLESFRNARTGKYTYLHLPQRVEGRPLAAAELIDMREVFRKAGKDVMISPELADAIDETYRKGEQTIILLNRRGFSQFVLCRSCGESVKCENCDLALTYHRSSAKLACHYCGFRTAVPDICPKCRSEYIYFVGHGTEQIEDTLEKRFPQMNIARIDRDTMSRKGLLAKTLNAFDRGETDMLVGTQMIAKGHDFHNVTLVGVISVDTGLGMPDLRSAERTFQLITQVAGRAGRGSLPGRVLIQTYYPEHYALRHAAKQDFEGFFKEEIRYRERLSYPPFFSLASILVRHKDLATATRTAAIMKEALDKANSDRYCRILGPAAASIARLKGEHRIQILIKSPDRKSLRDMIEIAADAAKERKCDMRSIQIEIDPVSVM